MNYIYDVLANFNPNFYDFFEWNKEDEITHIRKIPMIKIDIELYKNIKFNNIKVESEFLDKIENKTEIFKDKSVEKIEYSCILSDGKEATIIKFDKKGNNTYKSAMIIDEEYEVLESLEDNNILPIDYKVISINNIEFKTRKQIKKTNKIIKELNKLINNKEYEKLEYLYFECFNKRENNYKKIISEIKTNLDNHLILEKVETFFKLISNV